MVFIEPALQCCTLVPYHVALPISSVKKISKAKPEVEIQEITPEAPTFVTEAIQESEIESISPKGATIKTQIVKRNRAGKEHEVTIEQKLESGEVYNQTAIQGSELV